MPNTLEQHRKLFKNALAIRPGDVVRLMSRHLSSKESFAEVGYPVAFLGFSDPRTTFIEHTHDLETGERYGIARLYHVHGGRVDLESDALQAVRIGQVEQTELIVAIPQSGHNHRNTEYQRFVHPTMRVDLKTLAVVDN